MLSVLVVGAGPTGLLFSIWLKTLHPTVSLRVISDAAGTGTTSRAVVVQARTLEFYRQLDFVEEVLKKGHILQGPEFVEAGRCIGGYSLLDSGQKLTKYPFALAYTQEQHESLLLSQLEALGVQVEWNTKITACEVLHDSTMSATISHGGDGNAEQTDETVKLQYLIGCDGHASFVRKNCHIRMRGGTYSQVFFVADAHVETGKPLDKIYLSTTGERNYFMLALAENKARLIGCVKSDENEFEFKNHQHEVEERFGIKIVRTDWTSTYRVHHRVADEFRVANCFILGDAAHLHSPVGGQGMNTGLGDATNLAWKLAMVLCNKISPQILDTFAQERRPFAQNLVRSTDRIFSFVTASGLPARIFRQFVLPHFLPWLWKISAVRRRGFLAISQLAISYEQSDFSRSAYKANRNALMAGSRLPWIVDGAEDNFESLRANEFQFHTYGAHLGVERKFGVLVREYPSTAQSREAGLASDALYLIRPDGYVALVCKASDETSVLEFFEKWRLIP